MFKKEATKEKRINLLKSDVEKWNRYIRFCLKVNINFEADLSSADLSYANLIYANLSYANLSSANLSSADLSSADLSSAKLSSANLDFSLHFSCKWLSAKLDSKLSIQMLYHVAMPNQKNNIEDCDPDLRDLLDSELFKKVCNKFHRVNECGLII